jgi:flagellar FliL protein
MASTTATQQTIDAPAKSYNRKRIVLVVLISLAAAAAAAGGVYVFALKNGIAKSVSAPSAPQPPVFASLDPMTVNLLSDDGQHYLRIGLSVKLADEKTQEQLAQHMPEIRSRILLALSNKHPEELTTLDGKHALARELQALIEQPTDAGVAPVHVEGVLFTEFVVQ